MGLRNKCLFSLFLNMALIEIGYGAIVAFLPVYLAEYLKVSLKYIGIIIAVFSFSELILKIPGGWLADCTSRKLVLLVGIGLITLSFFLIAIVRDPIFFLPIIILNGAGMATIWPMTVAILADLVCEKKRGYSMGILGMVSLGGKGIGPVLGSLLIVLTNFYQAPFYLNAFLAALSFFAVLFWVREDKRIGTRRARGVDLAQLLRIWVSHPLLMILNLILFSQALGLGTLVPIIGLYANRVLGVSMEGLGPILLGPVALMCFLILWAGKLADKIGRAIPIKLGMGLLSLSLGILPLSQNWFFLAGVATIFGFGYALLMPAWTALVTEQVQEEQRGIVLGSIGSMQGLGFTVGPLVGTYLWHYWDASSPFYFCSFILGLGTILAVTRLRRDS